MTAPYRYRLILLIEVESDLQGHISPIVLRDVLRREADVVDALDDYIVLDQNREYITVLSEVAMEADFRPVDGQDENPGVA